MQALGCLPRAYRLVALREAGFEPVILDDFRNSSPVVLERLEREHPGQVMEVELEQEEGRWIYEVKLLQPQGQLVKLKLDARTGAVVKTRAQRAGSRERGGRDRERERD